LETEISTIDAAVAEISRRAARPGSSRVSRETEAARELIRAWEWRLVRLGATREEFVSRLAFHGQSRATAALWLSEPDTLQELPLWGVFLKECLAYARNPELPLPDLDMYLGTDKGRPTIDGAPALPNFLRPFVEVAFQRLRDSAGPAILKLAGQAAESWSEYLCQRLSALAFRTVLHELKQFSQRSELRTEQQFTAYLATLRTTGGRLALFKQYPVLARLLSETCLRQHLRFREFLEQLHADLPLLAAQFRDGRPLGRLQTIDWGQSDLHRDGHCVAILTFEDGWRVVYKPRSLATDRALARFSEWWNSYSPDLAFRVPDVLDREAYGWAEWVRPAPCSTDDEVRVYFRRLGATFAILGLLGSTDVHFENLLPSGTSPLVIDWECILSHHVSDVSACPTAENWLERMEKLLNIIPRWSRPLKSGTTHGLSSIAGSGMRDWPGAGMKFADPCTSRMRIVHEPSLQPTPSCLPRLGDELVDAGRYLPEFAAGFAASLEVFRQRRAELAAADGPLADLGRCESRYLPRDTSEYCAKLFWCRAPDQLTSGAAFLIACDLVLSDRPGDLDAEAVYRAETEAFFRGDIPRFTRVIDEPDLRDDWGRVVGRVQVGSGLQRIDNYLAALDDDAIHAQCDIACQSNRMLAQPPLALADDPAEAAGQIANWLCDIAIRLRGGVGWLNLLGNLNAPNLQFNVNLYDGSAGVVLFLINAAARSGDRRWRQTAERGLTRLIYEMDQEYSKVKAAASVIEGWGGVVYLLIEAARLLDDPNWLRAARRLADRWLEAVARESNPDLMAGYSGALRVLDLLQAVSPAGQYDKQIAGLVHRVQSSLNVTRTPEWYSPAGLAHGQLGAILSLLPHPSVFWDEDRLGQILQLELRGMDERAARSFDAGATLWCKGAVGAALFQLAAHREGYSRLGSLADSSGWAGRLANMPAADRQWLCCGDTSRIWWLSAAGHELGRQDLLDESRRVSRGLLEHYRSAGTFTLQRGREHCAMIGLMTGLAGVGLTMLHAANPQGISQVLTLGPALTDRLLP
jgi:type 2 lantibiotic biosynthesis protein LanM